MKSLITYLKNFFVIEKIRSTSSYQGEVFKADEILNDLISSKRIPGLAISVIKEGETIFQQGYGYAHLDKKVAVVPTKTVFRIASVSKNIAAMALLNMVSEKQIDLDTSFYKYVPYYPKKEHDFTIRQLAGHTAGIRAYKGKEYGLNNPMTIKDSINLFKDDPLEFTPGSSYLYNSFDWVLISLAIQEVSGIPFPEYVRKKVLVPLGLAQTFCDENIGKNIEHQTNKLELTEFYTKNKLGFRKAIPVNNTYKLAGGGFLSTVTDIAKFGHYMLEQKLNNINGVSEFIEPQKINNESTYYGLGWQSSEDDKGRPYFGHIGNGVGAYSNLFIYPEEKMVFALLTNCTNPNIQEELNDVVNCFIGDSQKKLV